MLTSGGRVKPNHLAIAISVTLMKPVLTEPSAIHAISPVNGDRNIGMMTSRSNTLRPGRSVRASTSASATPTSTERSVTTVASAMAFHRKPRYSAVANTLMTASRLRWSDKPVRLSR